MATMHDDAPTGGMTTMDPSIVHDDLAWAHALVGTERNRYLTLQIDELLTGTELDLDAIASRVGFASAAHLVRHFRKAHGMTPGAWRSLQHRGVDGASRAQHSARM